MAEEKNKKEKKAQLARTFIPGNWAIEKQALKTLASSTFGDSYFKENGAVDHVNICEDVGDGIFILHIDGILTYRSDLSTAWMGLDTYDSIFEAFNLLLNDPKCLGIILDINSVGGEVAGCADLVNAIYAARGSKPYGIVARSGGIICSAAYWIGSAAEKIYVSEQAVSGSVGVLCSYNSNETENEILIVSDLSPNKSPTPDDPDGLFLIKKQLNELATVFISSVARNRGTDFQTVLNNYGGGGTFVGAGAVAAGVVDGVISPDELINQMKNQTENSNMFGKPTEGKPNAATGNQPDAEALAAATSAAVATERTRVSGIQGVFKGLGLEDDCEKFISEGKSVDEARSFALDKCKTKISAGIETPAPTPEAIAAADAAAAKAALAGLTPTQKELIKKGLAAESSAQNGIQGGAGEQQNTKAVNDKIAKAAADRYYGRKK